MQWGLGDECWGVSGTKIQISPPPTYFLLIQQSKQKKNCHYYIQTGFVILILCVVAATLKIHNFVPCNSQLWRRHIGIVMIKSCKRRKLSFLCKWTWYCEPHVHRLPMILPENKMRHKLFLCAVCKIASIECSCLPSATKWVQCDCECAVERLGSRGRAPLSPMCNSWRLVVTRPCGGRQRGTLRCAHGRSWCGST